ncbi:MAG: glycosyltransferase family 2 protein, partial [Clostridiales bacterium]|nr:glycosyltransferase family 2 protein [Clostridiales bacterium]
MIYEDAVLGREEFKRHAESLAARHFIVSAGRKLPDSIPKPDECDRVIKETYNRIIKEQEHGEILMPSEEWLLDNYYAIREHSISLQREYYGKNGAARLRKISPFYVETESKEAVPRIFAISGEIIAHTDGYVDENAVLEFVEAYQRTAPLSTGELLELGFMLKLTLFGKISYICEMINRVRAEQKEAGKLFACCTGPKSTKALEIWLSDERNLTPAFTEYFLRLAAEKSEETDEFRSILSKKLAGRGITLDQLIASEHASRTALGVSMGNSITSLSNISGFDWDILFDKLCRVEQILLEDPAGVYAKMTRKSRGEYVERIDYLARSLKVSPESLALAAVELAGGCEKGTRESHVGYYFMGGNYNQLKKSINSHKIKLPSFLPSRGRAAFSFYISVLSVMTVLLSFAPIVFTIKVITETYRHEWQMYLLIGVFFILIGFIGHEIAVKITAWIFTFLYKPAYLPALDYSEGVPPENSVMVIIPTLIGSKVRVLELCSQMETAYFANRDENIYFAIVGDLKDSNSPDEKEDREILKAGLDEVGRLNASHGDKFFFFCRERSFSKTERKWIGNERKRGAVLEFNRLITKGRHNFTTASGRELPKIKYVFTLDADSVLPPGIVKSMCGIMAHPLNAPVIKKGVVTEGYGILQPAVKPFMSKNNQTFFTKVFSDEPGLDSYSGKLSEFYFDVSAEGIFTGKGMFDPVVFNALLDERFPDEVILSHDLLEGSYMRTAFASELCIYDGTPGNYKSYMKRMHRWVRGDWQLLSVPKKDLGFISQWKISDNLRRSLVPPGLLILYVLGMLLVPSLYIMWVSVFLLQIFIPWLMARNWRCFRRCFYELCFLPQSALYNCDAIVRSLWRQKVSHRHLLSWVTAADAEKKGKGTLGEFLLFMWFCFIPALAVINFTTPLWIAAPFLAWNMSLKYVVYKEKLTDREKREMRTTMRRIWAFYEDYATEGENWLPPDNVQFEPVYILAHRTSPTNIGLLIVSS